MPTHTITTDVYMSDARVALAHAIDSAIHIFPGGTTFLRADGVFAVPAGGKAESHISLLSLYAEATF